MTINEKQDSIIEEFEFLEDWLDKYQQIIDKGIGSKGIDPKYKTPEYIIEGCQSKVWVHAQMIDGKVVYEAESNNDNAGGIVVLDPVGVGATAYRTETAWKIIDECHPDIIRGNASEIMALINADIKSKGVDSSCSSDDAVESAKMLAARSGAIVVISGETDYVTDGSKVELIANGSPLMPRVTAMGCTASSMVGAFAAVNPDLFEASLNAMALMGVAGEIAARNSSGPGSLLTNFVDTLYNITEEELAQTVRQ